MRNFPLALNRIYRLVCHLHHWHPNSTTGTLKMRDMNLRDMKCGTIAGVENAKRENARNAIVWNTECCICLSIVGLLKVFTRLCDDV